MAVINVKSMSEIINNHRSLSREDLLARAKTPYEYWGNKWFSIEGEPTNDRGVSATAEFRVLGIEKIGTDLYRVSYRGLFFELGNGYRCLELKLFSETPRLCVEVNLSKEQHLGLMEHYKFH